MDYIIASVFLSICAIIEKRLLFIASFFIVGGYFCFNYGYGFDWINYRDDFLNSQNPSYQPFFTEPGLYLVMKLVSYFTNSYSAFVFLFVSFSYFCMYVFCRRLNNPSMGFFILFSFLGFYVYSEWIRQGFAIAFLLLIVNQFFERKNKSFMLGVFMLIIIHTISILSVFSVFFTKLSHKNIKKFLFFILLIFSFSIYSIFNGSAFNWLPIIGGKITAYAQNMLDTNTGSSLVEFIITSKVLYIYVIFFFMLCYRMKYYPELAPSIGVFFIIIFSRLFFVTIRIGYYFIPFFVYYFDRHIYKCGKGLKTNLFKFSAIVLFLAVSFIPMWSPLFWQGAKTHLNTFSSNSDANIEIGRKCEILAKNIDELTGRSCR